MSNNLEDLMTIKYSLEESDYILHQLYHSSKSPVAIKQRRNSYIFVISIGVFFGLLSYFKDNNIQATIAFVVFTIVCVFSYPIIENVRHKSHFKKHVKEIYKNSIGKTVEFEFSEDFIKTTENDSLSKISTHEISEINEIEKIIMIKLRTGLTLIIPKAKIIEIENLTSRLKELASSLNIAYNIELHWKWRVNYWA